MHCLGTYTLTLPFQCLFRSNSLAVDAQGNLEPGQTVFVNGGSSSVGAFAIQIAKAKGAAKVVASASGKNEEFVRGLGADEVSLMFGKYETEPDTPTSSSTTRRSRSTSSCWRIRRIRSSISL